MLRHEAAVGEDDARGTCRQRRVGCERCRDVGIRQHAGGGRQGAQPCLEVGVAVGLDAAVRQAGLGKARERDAARCVERRFGEAVSARLEQVREGALRSGGLDGNRGRHHAASMNSA